jgi:hypothetical protein
MCSVTGVPADRRRPLRAHLGELVVEHEHRVADAHERVHDRAVRHRVAAELLGAEGLLVEVHRLGAALDDEVRGQRVESVGDRFDSGHE